MSYGQPRVKYIPTQSARGFAQSADLLSERKKRWKLFTVTFVLTAAIGLIYTWVRPPVYETSSMLRIINVPRSGEDQATPLREQLVTHQQRIQSARLLGDVALELNAELGTKFGTDQLQQMLHAEYVADSPLLVLVASGETPALLESALNHWVDLYLRRYAHDRQVSASQEKRELQTQLAALKERQAAKRSELEEFRQAHRIVSLERDENRILNKMKALGASLDAATVEKAEARAQLLAIEEAMNRGETVVRPQDQSAVDQMEQRAMEHKESLRELSQTFTPEYMAIDPRIVGIQRKLNLLEEQVSLKRQESQQAYLQKTRELLSIAREKERDVATQLHNMEQQVQLFSSRLQEYTSLSQELDNLELEMHGIQQELLKQDVREPHEAKVEILERPYPPGRPVSPDYWRDSLISVAAALLLAILTIGVYALINRREDSAITPMSYPGAVGRERRHTDVSLPSQDFHSISYQPPRELAVREVAQLLSLANDQAALLTMLLLIGLTPEELFLLRWTSFDLTQGSVTVLGPSARCLKLPQTLKNLCRNMLGEPEDLHRSVWATEELPVPTLEWLRALLYHTAKAAAIDEAETVAMETLRHTYLAFLARNGLRLSDIEQIAGHMPAEELGKYRIYFPPGAEKTIGDLDCIYPTLQGTATELPRS